MLPKLSFQNQVNAVGILAIVIAAGYVVGDMFTSTATPPCSSRLGTATQMSLKRADGQPLSAAELQAKWGMSERHVAEKLSVTAVPDGPAPFALSVAIGGALAADTGAGFDWPLPGVEGARNACLVYNVHVPAGFEFADGGRLPGFKIGTVGVVQADMPSALTTRLMWNDQGQLSTLVTFDGAVHTPGSPDAAPLHLAAHTNLARGQWVRIEQEVDLGLADGKEGALRTWVNGRLVTEQTGLNLRRQPGLRFAGVIADIGYLPPVNKPERPATNVRLSPLQLSWK